MVEGSVHYADDDNVLIAVNVKGSKSDENMRSKMDIEATKINGTWEYQKIQVRIKKPVEKKETIPIFKK